MLDQVEERLPRPTGCRRRRRRAAVPRQRARASCERPRRSPRRTSASSLSPSRERIAAAAVSSGGKDVELLQHLDDGPVRDPLAVGQAAAVDDRRLASSRATSAASRDLPTPASPTTVTSSQRISVACAFPGASRSDSSSSVTADERRFVTPLWGIADPKQPVRRERAPTCPSARAARSARPRRRRGRARASALRSAPRPVIAACSSRAATLTASPVARRSSVPVTTSPVITPMRPSRPSSGSASRISARCPDGAEGVVLVDRRHPEHGHHGVADELLDAAPVALDDAFMRSK